MLVFCLVAVPPLALLGLLAAYAAAGREPGRRILPAARTAALLSTAAAYVAFLFAR